jgi:hypothetical protein
MRDSSTENGADDVRVPLGVLRGLDDVANGRTASVDDVRRVLKF